MSRLGRRSNTLLGFIRHVSVEVCEVPIGTQKRHKYASTVALLLTVLLIMQYHI